MPKKPVDEKIVSRLEMAVNFETVLSDSEIEEIIDKAKEQGHVVKATYRIMKTHTRELV